MSQPYASAAAHADRWSEWARGASFAIGRMVSPGAGVAKSYSVTGDTVNTAQRLQSMAPSGEVLVGPLTYRLTRHAFAYESLGDVALKGKMGNFACWW